MSMQIVFATNNPNKLKEIRSIVGNGIKILSLSDIQCDEELPETRDTLEGNALQKAQYVFDNYGYSCFADDTGLEVDALSGRPGVYSARYAGPDCSSKNNIEKLLKELKNENDRRAQFRTVIAWVTEKDFQLFEGQVEGSITESEIGEGGFGYDPVFIPSGYEQSFAQMTAQEKNAISHRSRAMQKFISALNA